MKRAKFAARKPVASSAVKIVARADPNVVTVPVAPPRNPYVSLAHRRKAGVHGESGRTRRQAEKRELRAKLHEE